jgi:uncharacterized membrane protein
MQAAKAPTLLRHVLLRIRLFSAVGIGLFAYLVLPSSFASATRGLIAWNVAIVAYLTLMGFMMARSTHESMRRRAKELDEGHYTVLVLAVVAALSSLAAIVFELFNLRNATGGVVALHIGLSAATIITSWSFVHVIFTEHYAHAFYFLDDGTGREADPGESQDRNGLHFPSQPRPDYLDFLYFAFTIGVANQTADIAVMSRGMRALVLIHSIISYFFNTIVLALTINIAASMLGG